MSQVRADIRAEGDRVVFAIEGRAYVIPWQAALELGRALTTKGREAEEFAAANRIIADQALLERSGAPFALSNNRLIRSAARTAAQWDSLLRRYIKATPRPEQVGVPTVITEPPRGPRQ